MIKILKIKIPKIFYNNKLYINFLYLSYLFLFSFFVLQTFLLIRIGSLPSLNLQRILLVVLIFWICSDKNKLGIFIQEVKSCKYNFVLFLYLIVCIYTAVFRRDINTVFGVLVDCYMTFYLFFYFFRKIFTIEDILRFIKFCLMLVCIMGIIEFITGFNFFTTFQIGIGNISDSIDASYRDGILRVRGPYGHSLAYGLVINLFFPLTCLDLKKNEINILNNIFLFIIVSLNIFFTGARSSLGLFLLEVLVISLLSPKKVNRKNLLLTLFTILTLGTIFIFFSDSEIVVFLKKQFYYVYDTIFGTNMAYEFGGDSSIKASSIARDRLWKIFLADSINPWIGQGVSSKIAIRIGNWNVTSIDNYYVKLFITLGIPGLITLVLFFIQAIFSSAKEYFIKKEPLFLIIFISQVCYLINLFVVDELSTLKYFFFLVALQVCAGRYILKEK